MPIVDPALPTPVYEQIREAIAAQRASGELTANHRLPTVRTLAAELGVAPNTVARAYRELEASGLIETRGRQGSFVTGTEESREKVAAQAARDYASLARSLRLDDDQAVRLVRAALAGDTHP